MMKSLVFLYPSAPAFLLALQHMRNNRTELFSLMMEEVQRYAIFTISTNGIITTWNKGSESLMGYTKEEAVGKPLATLFPEMVENGHLQEDIKNAIENGQYEHTTLLVTKNKQKLSVKCVVTALWKNDNELKGFSKIVHTIAPQEISDKNREELLSLAGHELKNPITSIKAYLQLLELKLIKKKDTELVPTVSKAISQVDKLNHLLKDMLDTSRIAIGSLPYHDTGDVYLDEFLENLLETIRVTYPHNKFHLHTKRHLLLYHIDRERLEQVIINLLRNAIQYSREKDPINIAADKTSSDILVSVSDKGIGISKKELKNIFDKFYRGNNAKKINQGLGLGLHVAQEIVHHYGGKIWVESTKGKGSTFFISLPIQSSYRQD